MASKGCPGPRATPPPPATPGSASLVLPKPARASPVTARPGCAGLSPVQRTGPWGPPSQVHVHPYSSGHPRSVCAPFGSLPIVELKSAGRQLSPWLHQAAGKVEASPVNNSEKQLEAAHPVSVFQRSQPPSCFMPGVPRLKFGESLLVLLNYPHKLRSGPANRNWFPSHVCHTAAVDLCSLIYRTRGGCESPRAPTPGPPHEGAGGMQSPWGPCPAPAGPWGGPAPAPGPRPGRR